MEIKSNNNRKSLSIKKVNRNKSGPSFMLEKTTHPNQHIQSRAQNVKWGGSPISSSFFEVFKNKQYAKNFLLYKMDPEKAYIATFGEDAYKNARQAGIQALEDPAVQNEIQSLLPADHDTASIIKEAYAAPTPAEISWSDKHKYLETVMKVKNQLGKDREGGGDVKVGVVIEIGEE